MIFWEDADWFFYLCKELSHVLTTYLKDLRVLSTLLGNQHATGYFPVNLIRETESLVNNVTTLMRDKEIWEESRHGLEIAALCAKYFTHNQENYSDYFGKLAALLGHVVEDFSCYVSVENICMKPVAFLQYYAGGFCAECRCCGGTGGNRKVNFSPVLTKKQRGDEVLDGIVLAKVHNGHLVVGRILEAYDAECNELMRVVKTRELARDMDGFSNITKETGNSTGEFVKQGILLKLNKRKGLQNRIFFLFQHVLVYGTRVSSTQGFRLHGMIMTRNMELLDMTQITSIPNSFSIIVKPDSETPNNDKILVLAAFNGQDQSTWISGVRAAIEYSKSVEKPCALVSRLFNSSEELLSARGSTDVIANSNTQINTNHNRSNALSHVCWHRNISIDSVQIIEKDKHQISGPLLRKFKNSPGWQRLWVVFSNVCLYFYKSANELSPLASLPLLGYKIELLSDTEKSQINKEHSFKLVFKNHVYYFRAESSFTFNRWVSVLKSACVQ